MTKKLVDVITQDDLLDCFGDFNKSDRLCSKYCILRLRCAIEQEQNLRSVLLEELVAAENSTGKLQ
jgi:hypothetical protein